MRTTDLIQLMGGEIQIFRYNQAQLVLQDLVQGQAAVHRPLIED
jgi:DNA-binding transcriptional regulator of glucitol operon